MSIRLLLESFLGLMKESGELDKLLPLLVTSMGHDIPFSAQKGIREYGIDVVSVGKDPEDGRRKIFYWLIKCGDIGRAEWNLTNQSIRQSIDDAGDTFLSTNVLPQHKKLSKKLVILTNGIFKTEIRQTLSQYLEKWNRTNKAESLIVNGSLLASWTEKYLFDENILPPEHRTLFRRVLANIANPELSVPVGRQLIKGILESPQPSGLQTQKQTKRRLSSFRAVRTALTVIFQWSINEGGLETIRQLSEFAVLESWAQIQNDLEELDKAISEEFAELQYQMLSVGQSYFTKIHPYLVIKDALSLQAGDALVTNTLTFREIGQLGLHGVTWGFFATEATGDVSILATQWTLICSNLISKILQTHEGSQSPAFDYQAVEIHCGLLCLMITGKRNDAAMWVTNIIGRLGFIVKDKKKFWPMVAQFEEVLETRNSSSPPNPEFLDVSSLIPILALWCAVLDIDESYQVIRQRILPSMPDLSLNIWSSDQDFDGIISDQAKLHESGFGQVLSGVPETASQLLSILKKEAEEIPSLDKFSWYRNRVPMIPLLAALHWKLQIPKQMLVEHISAFQLSKGAG
ncbi:hypothetical protein [Rugamonas apoptosis]|uniref:Uncharacterized protein n=1 Tax=Rugamonas apoptosis TaxID=2758570 RepID=A0A7W2IJ95_9BURK|nr:hypothetical protein [Rugamonas apoptosis]MBA5686328.1 hypothetical protein [Rugamonas apoptosis]